MNIQFLVSDEKVDAPSSGHACTITTGDAGELALDFYMFESTTQDASAMVIMQDTHTYLVGESSASEP